MTQPATPEQLLAWTADASSRTAFSTLTKQSFLLLDATAPGLSAAQQQRVADWLRQLPCPALGFAEAPDNPVAAACDALTPNETEAEPLIAGLRRNPVAATVLVQLLRAIEGLPLEAALTAESLAYSTLQSGLEYREWLADNRAAAPFAHTDEGAAVLMRREGAALKLELNRASNHNAMSVEMRDALMEALELVLADDAIGSIDISGRGKCFSTGGDLTEFGSAPDPATAHLVRGLALPGRLLAQCAARATVKVHGACIGSGIEFPAFAGRIIASEDAHFQLPELRFGLIPGAGGCVSIARRIGRQRTAWMVLSGKRINVRRALEWGLVDALA